MQGICSTEPVTKCSENSVWQDDYDDLAHWTKISTYPKEYYEDCAFTPGNVGNESSVMKLTARSSYKGIGAAGDFYYGGQVTSDQTFSAAQDYTLSCIMKPSGANGVVNAFAVRDRQVIALRSEDRCDENDHEIDMEIVNDTSGMLSCTFTTWVRAYNCMRNEDDNEHCADYSEPDNDRINCSSYVLLPRSFAESFHKYGFRWTTTSVVFMIDDSVVSIHDRSLQVLNVVPTREANITISTWVANAAWTGPGEVVPNGTVGVCEVDAVCVTDNTTGVANNTAVDFRISSPYPNPSAGTAAFDLEIVTPEYITLKVYDILGNEVATLLSQYMQPGKHACIWNTGKEKTGIYYYKLSARAQSKVGKIIVF
jgi:beta-glucanase (GH16 family)